MSDAVSADSSAVGAPFSVGRTLSRAAAVFSQSPVPFILLTAIANIPLLILALLRFANPKPTLTAALALPFLQIAISSLSTAVCLLGAYQVMRGRPFTIGESLMAVVSRYRSVLGASLLGALFSFLLLLLLIVPGLIYICMIYVSLPACVVEGLGPMASLTRSRELTKGYRWQIFGLLLITGLASFAIAYAIGFLFTLVLGPTAHPLGRFFGEVLVGAFASVLYGVAYSELRAAKEGVDVDQLARVFD